MYVFYVMFWGTLSLDALCLYLFCLHDGLTLLLLCPFLSLVTKFVSKSILPYTTVATSALFWILFVWDIFFNPFTFNLLCL